MKKIFQDRKNVSVDLIEYCAEAKTKLGATIHIGTDSVVKGDEVLYVIVVAIRYGNKGAHFIYKKERGPRPKDKLVRLQKEVELTVEYVQYMIESMIPPDTIEFDLNSNKRYASNKVLSYAAGWGSWFGIPVKIKPDEQVAVKAADHICKPFKTRK